MTGSRLRTSQLWESLLLNNPKKNMLSADGTEWDNEYQCKFDVLLEMQQFYHALLRELQTNDTYVFFLLPHPEGQSVGHLTDAYGTDSRWPVFVLSTKADASI